MHFTRNMALTALKAFWKFKMGEKELQYNTVDTMQNMGGGRNSGGTHENIWLINMCDDKKGG